jgi:tripeptide aminopeptidase
MAPGDPAELIAKAANVYQPLYKSLQTGDILQRAITIQQIAAPTFAEQTRAEFVEAGFQKLGLRNVARDALNNVYGWWGDAYPVIVVSAHLDTVFPVDTDLTVHHQKTRVYGPGLGDNSLGVAVLLLLAELFTQQATLDEVSLCFVANSREEGLGNLDGIRAVAETISPARIHSAVVIEGMALGRVYHAGIAVRRLKIEATTEGGHSWLNFGKPSAIHSLVQLAADVTRLSVPAEPRTTFNIGLIEGGHSVNSIATHAHFYLDLRSTLSAALSELEEKIHELVTQHTAEEIQFHVEVAGDRPAGSIPADHPLVQLALAALAEIGIAGVLEHGSTDANILLAKGVPTVVVGVTHGGHAHRLDEFIETPPLVNGVWQIILLLAGLIDQSRTGLPGA